MKNGKIKKLVMVILVIGISLSGYGCKIINQNIEDVNNSMKSNGKDSDAGIHSDLEYTIVDESYETEKEENYQAVNIHIPVIKEIETLSIVDYYNEQLGKELSDYKNKRIKLGDGDYYHLDYEISTMTNDLISVIFRGESYVKNKTHPIKFVYTYNIDLKTGSTVCLSQNNDIEKIAELIMSGEKLKLVKPAELDDEKEMKLEDYMQEFQKYSKEEWIKKLKNADINIIENSDGSFTKEEKSPMIYSYIKDEKTILAIKVSHKLGDYVEIMLP
ncbi:hypothetical protein [Anaerosacchariphilus polymeriproducens]|uniref:Deacetylase PdaC domain-containing protein n=1 Tax=Anaerosacchariphilus polymeriproducens TaxID=1812858 RepID=A0A371ATQ1_9FIRM|nr:hypothetical protein [Anaerosacchariphilus polymeriproducens]RDU22954.1 hypothetical protein DWV06_11305 [Anaerosacchariphilus polymeriproducens]